MSELNISISKI